MANSFKDVYRRTITDRQEVLSFGKFKGCTIEFVMEHNPQYLLFCQEKMDSFDLSSEILDELESTEDERYFLAQMRRENSDAYD